jgi:hypothetical protein
MTTRKGLIYGRRDHGGGKGKKKLRVYVCNKDNGLDLLYARSYGLRLNISHIYESKATSRLFPLHQYFFFLLDLGQVYFPFLL